MDSKVNNILNIIISNENDRCLFNDQATYDYLSKLGNSTFDQILSEPMCLNDETKTLTEQTQELALNNYRTFIETAECSTKISKDFDKSKNALNEFIDKVPKFMSGCENFSTISKDIIKERGYNDQIKYQSEQLLSVLELPILMQTALNNGDYESALDLFTYIRNLSRKYNDLSAVQNITSEVTKLWFETLHRLFNQLRNDLPLPQCLQILGYLRRANVVYESTMDDVNPSLSDFESSVHIKSNKLRNAGDGLQLHFLKARGNWFDTALMDAMDDDSDKHLRKIVELHRIHLFNILTQHKAIFLTDTQSKLKGDDLNGIAALSCWLKEKVNKLTAILEYNITQEDDASFESLLSQCMYLCLSFGRVGADMRGVMAPMFRDIIFRCFSESTSKANSQFESDMKAFKITGQNKISKKTIGESEQNQNSPPESLLEFYPLAEYCNNILSAMNVLRVTAPLCLVMKVLEELSHSLTSVSKSLMSFYNREQHSLSDIEQFTQYCTMFKDELIPYIQKCICQIFPPSLIAEQMGVSVAMMQEEKLINLDSEKITLVLFDILNSKS